MEVDAGWLYNASVGQLGVAWQFDARTFVRAILQNVDYEFNTAVDLAGREPEYQHLFSQLLFSYKLNPQTVLFVGCSFNSTATSRPTSPPGPHPLHQVGSTRHVARAAALGARGCDLGVCVA
jgi:hypothetical protein